MPDVANPDSQVVDQLDSLLGRMAEELHLPGAALAVVKDGHVIYERAVGYRDVDNRLPATVDTIFPIGSATKPFTSMTVALAKDRGLMSLEDHPRAYLPYFKMYDAEADAKVTIRDLLSHRTGIMSANEFSAQSAQITREGLVKATMSARPTAPFRTKFQYSNVSYVTVGEIIERAYGMPWEEVIRRNIFAPLGMTNSIASLNERTSRPDYALGYVFNSSGGSWTLTPYTKTLNELAAAGMIGSSVRDMSRWVEMLSQSGTFRGQRFVSKEMFDELTTPEMQISPQISYSLGWANYTLGSLRVIEHNGGGTGISALISFVPDQRVGFVFMANTSPNRMTAISNAGQLIYPIVLKLGSWSAKPVAVPEPDPTRQPLPTVSAVLARAITEAGGQQVMQLHRSAELNGTKSYDNHGVLAQLQIFAQAPAARMENETWSAAGQNVGRIRSYFDGQHGGQDVSFQGHSSNDPETDRRARLSALMHPFADLSRVCKSLELTGYDHVAGEAAYVLHCVPVEGDPLNYYIATRSARLLRRAGKAESSDFSDYRRVDGELVPFIVVTSDESGITTTHVETARFNVPVSEGSFTSDRSMSPRVR